MPTLNMPTRDYGLMMGLKGDGKLGGGIEIEFPHFDNILVAARQMVREVKFDICEMPTTTYLCAKGVGKPFTALPVFITRNFHHGAIFVDRNAGISSAKDFEGKAVGVVRGYTVTTGVWARAILNQQLGVDLTRVQWKCTDDEHVAEFELPPFADYEYKGRELDDLFREGIIVGAVGAVPTKLPNVQPLFDDPVAAGFESYRKTGVYPVNHTIVVRDAVLQKYPDFAPDLFRALVKSKQAYYAGLDRTSSNLSAEDALTVRLEKGLGGDPFPYGVKPNAKVLESLMKAAVDQRILPRPFSLDELFAPGTLDLEG